MAGSDTHTAVDAILRVVCMADVEPKPIEWLWHGKIALGKLTLLSGDPGLGKSIVSTALASAVSSGARWPVGGGMAPRGSVIILSAEDGVEDTIRPRLDAAEANCRHIHVLRAVRERDDNDEETERPFSLAEDIGRLDVLVRELRDCKLVIIDPVSAYLGRTDSHKNAEVRAVLSPLADMAEQLNVAILAVTHLNKGGGSAMYRSIGSIAFTAAARAAWVVTKDRDDPERRLILPVKNNLAPDRLGMAYCIETADNGSPVVTWEPDPVDVDINDALSTASEEFRSERNDAIDWLKTELKDGAEVSASDMKQRAKADGHSWATVRRAKGELRIKPHKREFASGWWWKLPPETPGTVAAKMITPQGIQPSKGEHGEHLRQNQSLTDKIGSQDAQGAHPGEREHLGKSQFSDDGESEIF